MMMKLRSYSSERDLIEADDVRDVCIVAGGVEVEVEDGGVHHLLDCLGIDVGEFLIVEDGEDRGLGDRVDLDQVPSTVEVRIKFFDGSLLLNIFLCRRSFF